MVGWSRVFGEIPIHLPKSAEPWVMRPDASIEFYPGDRKPLFGGLSLHRTGGHFDSSQVLHWPAGAQGKGVLLTTDEPFVTPGGDNVSFMYSFPNAIPLDASRIRGIAETLAPLDYDCIYSGWWNKVLRSDAKKIVKRSIDRYLDILNGRLNPTETPSGIRNMEDSSAAGTNVRNKPRSCNESTS